MLLGDMFWTERLGRRLKISGINVHQFAMKAASFSCALVASALAWINNQPQDFASYVATIVVEFTEQPLELNGGHLPASTSTKPTDLVPSYVCTAQVLQADDPLNVFRPHVHVNDSSPYFKTITVSLPASQIPPAYFAPDQHYPCRVLISTSGGTRIVTLDPVVQASDRLVRSATFVRSRRGLALLVVDDQSVALYDCRYARAPRLVDRTAMANLTGATQVGDQVLVYGEEGVFACEASDDIELQFRQRSRGPVRVMASLGASTVVLLPDRVEMWSRGGQAVSSIEAPEGVALAAGADYVGVAHGDKALMYARDADGVSTLVATYQFEAILDLYTDVWTGEANNFVLAARARTTTVTISPSGHLRVVAEYPGAVTPPRGQRAGNLFVTSDWSTGKIRIFAPGRMATL